MSRRPSLFTLVALMLVSACSFRNVSCSTEPPAPIEPVALSPSEDPVPQGQPPVVGIAFLGDSITAGLGLMTDEAYPAIVRQMFETEGYTEVDILNAGLSGDTTAGGARRVDQILTPGIRILVVALGGNDALRGLTVAQTKENLAGIIDTALGRDVMVVLVGMQAPTNLGIDYQEGFRGLYQELALEYSGAIRFIPFLLQGVAGNPQYNQADGIHPNQEGQRMIAELLYDDLRDLVDNAVFSGQP